MQIELTGEELMLIMGALSTRIGDYETGPDDDDHARAVLAKLLEAHRADDPHCTCNDCIAFLEGSN